MIEKKKAFFIFKLLWIYLLITNIADLRLHTSIDLLPFIHFFEIPFIKYLPFVLALFLIIPYREFSKIISDKNSRILLVLAGLLIITAVVSSNFASYRDTAFALTARFFFYYIILILLLIANNYFDNLSAFLIKSFVYINIMVIAGSLLDYYLPGFNSILVKHFDRPEIKHSVLKIGDKVFMRPMGILTDTNLTAFSVCLSMILLLLNHRHFNKYFMFIFFAAGSYVSGMLASRASLLMCIIAALYFFITQAAVRKHVYIFFLIFVVFQAITPQTYSRFFSEERKSKVTEEFTFGRPVIWKAALNVFYDYPLLGAGPGNFFEISRDRIRDVIFLNNPGINIDDPDSKDHHEVGKGNPHNLFLAVLSELGITGFIIFILLMFYLINIYIKRKHFTSLLFLLLILMVSAVSNFAPYYRFYLLTCIILYIIAKADMRIMPFSADNTIKKFRDVRKIMIFKLCCFGDTVFMSPAVCSLKKAFPDAEIYYAYAEWIEPMIKYIPELNGSILFKNVYSSNVIQKIRGTFRFIKRVRMEKFDMVLNGHRSSMLSLILSLCNIKYRLGFEGTSYLTHTAPFRSGIQEYLRYQDILANNNIPVQNVIPYLNKPDVKEILEKHGIEKGSGLIGIFPFAGNNPGTQMKIKRWDMENFFMLAMLINQKMPEKKILFFEGKSENEKCEIPTNINAKKAMIDNDLIACCKIFISADTGSLHIAAGFNIPTISVFGPTDPDLLAPVNIPGSNIKHVVIRKRLSCSPCYTPQTAIERKNQKYWQGNEFICYIGTNECMKMITVNEVYETLYESLK